jgi:acetyl-CoA synthetase (ADP-forming)
VIDDWSDWRLWALKRTLDIFYQAAKEGRKNLLETEARAVCLDYGIPIARYELATNKDEAVCYAQKIGFPIVLKIVSPDIIHKSEVGGVRVNLKDEEEVQGAYGDIISSVKKHADKARIIGMLIQEMAPPSTEVIVGSTKDPQFGPTIMFGLGGILVEILKDITFRIAPITREEAQEMITEIKAYPILQGYRGAPPSDTNAIVDILLATSRLVTEQEEIKELDLNPIIVYQKGAKTVDARIILE